MLIIDFYKQKIISTYWNSNTFYFTLCHHVYDIGVIINFLIYINWFINILIMHLVDLTFFLFGTLRKLTWMWILWLTNSYENMFCILQYVWRKYLLITIYFHNDLLLFRPFALSNIIIDKKTNNTYSSKNNQSTC